MIRIGEIVIDNWLDFKSSNAVLILKRKKLGLLRTCRFPYWSVPYSLSVIGLHWYGECVGYTRVCDINAVWNTINMWAGRGNKMKGGFWTILELILDDDWHSSSNATPPHSSYHKTISTLTAYSSTLYHYHIIHTRKGRKEDQLTRIKNGKCSTNNNNNQITNC